MRQTAAALLPFLATASLLATPPEPDEALGKLRRAERRIGTRLPAGELPEIRRRAALFGLEAPRSGRSPLAAGPAWTSIGPAHSPSGRVADDSGMISSIAAHPTDPATFYVAPNGGGVWKTTDGGASWRALLDEVGGSTVMGAVAVAPSAPDWVYAGTGSGVVAPFHTLAGGFGLLRSTDGGGSWSLTASSPAEAFYTILVDGSDPRTLLAAGDRGVQRSTDAGESWTAVLAPEGAWASSLVRLSPTSPVLLAATFRMGFACYRYGPAIPSRIWKSTDAGLTWAEKSAGLQAGASGRGRISLAVSASAPNVAYALAADLRVNEQGCVNDLGGQNGLYKSTDGGESWTLLPGAPSVLGTQGNYANMLGADPRNAEIVYAGGLEAAVSTDGGASWRMLPRESAVDAGLHVDHHALAFAADGAALFGNDGGIVASPDGGTTFRSLNRGLVTMQFYSVCASPLNPGQVMGGTQDNGTVLRRSSDSWQNVIGGDGFDCVFHPTSSTLILGSVYDELVYRSTNSGGTFRPATLGLDEAGTSTAKGDTLFRTRAGEPDRVMTATSSRLYETQHFGESWSALSAPIPGVTAIIDFVLDPADGRHVVVAAHPRGLHDSTDGGRTFTRTGDLPAALYLNTLVLDRSEPRRFLIASGGNDRNVERVFLTTDAGATWTPISRTGAAGGLPDVPVLALAQDPSDPATFWVGSFVGVYRSTDRGATWRRYGSGLPNVPVMAFHFRADGQLLAASYGRGIWQITPAPDAPNSTPVAEILEPGPRTVEAGLPVTFRGRGTDPDAGDTVSLRWDFGDGGASSSAETRHAFAVPGERRVTLTATDSSGASSSTSIPLTIVRPDAAEAAEKLLPVVLDIGGVGGSHYTTELVVGTSAPRPVTVVLEYTASVGSGSGFASLELGPLGQRTLPDAILFLRSSGLPIPADGSGQVGTLRLLFRGAAASEAFVGARTSTPGGGGSFGLFYGGAASTAGTLVVAGLQENAAQRSNLALVNAGPDPVTLRVRLQGGAGEDLGVLDEPTLPGFGWKQLNRPLEGRSGSGVARVERVSGSSPFSAYGVLNDAVTSDGSFVPPLVAGSTGAADRMVPIVLDVRGLGGAHFTTELTLANLTDAPMPLALAYRAAPSLGDGSGSGTVPASLAAREQRIVPDVLAYLRSGGLLIPEAPAGGSLLVSPPPATGPGGLFVGARVSTPGQDGGSYGLFYPGVTLAESRTDGATLSGLRQDARQRSNVAVVNRGDAGDAITLRLTYSAESGAVLGDPVVVTLAPGEWRQFGQPLAALGAGAGRVRVERLSGASRFLAYAVLNDAATSDGSYVAPSD